MKGWVSCLTFVALMAAIATVFAAYATADWRRK